jgi:hypothetical protein
VDEVSQAFETLRELMDRQISEMMDAMHGLAEELVKMDQEEAAAANSHSPNLG